jgi:hypothetical protein
MPLFLLRTQAAFLTKKFQRGNSIQGQTFLSPEHMNLFVKTINPAALELGIYYLTLGEYYGIRGDIAFAQAMHETDWDKSPTSRVMVI